MKKILIVTVLFLPIYVYSQPFFNDSIIVLGIKDFDSLVSATPDVICDEYVTNIKYTTILTEKSNLWLFIRSMAERFNYSIFSPTCYRMFYYRVFILEDVVPYIQEKYAELLTATYSKENYFDNNFDFYSNEEEEYRCFKIRLINHKKYLAVLMHLKYYNNIQNKISPSLYLFKGTIFEDKLYITVLIPIR